MGGRPELVGPTVLNAGFLAGLSALCTLTELVRDGIDGRILTLG